MAEIVLAVVLVLGLASPSAAQTVPGTGMQSGATLSDTRAAAEKGEARAQYRLGAFYYEGEGVPQSAIHHPDVRCEIDGVSGTTRRRCWLRYCKVVDTGRPQPPGGHK